MKYRYLLTSLCFFACANIFTMRANLSVALLAMVKSSERINNETSSNSIEDNCIDIVSSNQTHLIKEDKQEGDFTWSIKEQNFIQSCYFYGYVVSSILVGRMTEILGPKCIAGGGILLSSIVTIASPYIAQLGSSWFSVSRVLIGLGGGVVYPALHYTLGLWYPQNERGIMYSIFNSGAKIGTAVTFPLTAFLCQSSAKWPSSFYSLGIFGIVWCIFWFFLMYDCPEKHPYISTEELQYILSKQHEEGQTKEKMKVPWMSVLTSVPVWATAIAMFGHEWGNNVIMIELPIYMSHIQHFELIENGGLDALPYVVEIFATIMFGIISDWILAKKFLSVNNIRKLFTALGNFLPASCLLIITFLGCDRVAVVCFMILAVSFTGAIVAGCELAIIDMAPNFSGTIMGLCNGFAQLSGVISLPILGFFTSPIESRKQWNKGFYLTIGMYVVTTLMFLLWGNAQLQHWSTTKDPIPPHWITFIRKKFGL